MNNDTYKFAAPKSLLSDDTARVHYRHVATVALAYGIAAAALKAAAAKWNPSTPTEWVVAAMKVSNKCEKCNGRGVYYWGAVVNGKPSHRGDCFACEGNGQQDHADRKRCLDYWAFGVRAD